jgi:hypothetical protein
MGVYETADPITTNQKAAGSSPAERAKENSTDRGVFLFLELLLSSVIVLNLVVVSGDYPGMRRVRGLEVLSIL